MSATTGETRDRAPNPPDSSEVALAIWTFVEKTVSPPTNWERQIVTTFLVADAEIMAGGPPFFAMGHDPFSVRAKLSQQMRELVSKGSIDFGGAMLPQSWI
jgi:hypothetical protein